MLCRYRTCANAIENAAGVKVTADADNLKTVFLAEQELANSMPISKWTRTPQHRTPMR
jgi:hypothetical protein